MQSVIDAVTAIPSLILDGIREIFIPNTEHIDDIWSDTVDTISAKFGFVSYDLGDLFSQSKEIEDIQGDYTFYGLGTLNLTFFDTQYLKQGLLYFRPFIRGFIILLCVFYNIRQALGFFGYSSGEIKSAAKDDD